MFCEKKVECYATLGPSCCSAATLYHMFEAGMTGVRLNLSHVKLSECGAWLNELQIAAKKFKIIPDLLIDLQGPELRTGTMKHPLTLEKGQEVTLGHHGEIEVPSILFAALRPGQRILMDDGSILLEAETCEKDHAICKILRGGTLTSRKSIAVPGAKINPPTLTADDLDNLSVAAQYGVTGVMLPFVRSAEDLKALKTALRELHEPDIRIFAKIENQAGVDSLKELLAYCDHIVIARGDLGNDVSLWQLPAIQKKIAAQCRVAQKPFMVVTQMLDSMHHREVPTRAEVSDIFNAVLDGAASVMLTGETAAGEYPVAAMQYLCNTVKEACEYMK